MGCQTATARLQRKRRRYLMIVKQNCDDESVQETDDIPVFGSDLDAQDLSPFSKEERLSCDVCDLNFADKESLSQHSSSHSVDDSSSSFLLNLEDTIYEKILAETPDIDKSLGHGPAELSEESLLENYGDLVDNLIASVSPDDFLDKVVTNNEVPDNYNPPSNQPDVRTLCVNQPKFTSIKSKSNHVEEKVKTERSVIVSKIETKRCAEDCLDQTLIKKPKAETDIGPANKKHVIRKKDFKGCSAKNIEVKAEKMKFSISIPEVINVESLKDDDPTLDKMFKTSMSRMKKFKEAEKLFDDKYRSNRCKYSETTSFEDLREAKKKSCKRGRLAFTVYSDLKNIACPRKKYLGKTKEVTSTEKDSFEADVDNPEDVNEEFSEKKKLILNEPLSQSLVEMNPKNQLEENSSPDQNFSMPILDF